MHSDNINCYTLTFSDILLWIKLPKMNQFIPRIFLLHFIPCEGENSVHYFSHKRNLNSFLQPGIAQLADRFFQVLDTRGYYNNSDMVGESVTLCRSLRMNGVDRG